jgi:hypothetical protein
MKGDNLFVLLNPDTGYTDFIDERFAEKGINATAQDLLGKAINERYFGEGKRDFEHVNAVFPGELVACMGKMGNSKIITAPQTKNEYFSFDAMTHWGPSELFGAIADKLNVKGRKSIFIGGFHIGDCVTRLADAISKINRNVIIDPAVTDASCEVLYSDMHSLLARQSRGMNAWQPTSMQWNNLDAETLKLRRLMQAYNATVLGNSTDRDEIIRNSGVGTDEAILKP